MNKFRARANGRIFNLVSGSSSFRVKNESKTTTRIDLYDEISYYGIMAADFARELQGITTDSVDLHINSPGGDVFEGITILNNLRQYRADGGILNVIVDGLAASAASFIAMSGDSVTMAKNSELMIHDAFGLVVGNAADMTEMADRLNRVSDNIASIYADKAGGSIEDWRNAMLAETWYSADEAVSAGLADKVAGSSSVDNVYDLSIYNGRNSCETPIAAKFVPETKTNEFDFTGLAGMLKQAFEGE